MTRNKMIKLIEEAKNDSNKMIEVMNELNSYLANANYKKTNDIIKNKQLIIEYMNYYLLNEYSYSFTNGNVFTLQKIEFTRGAEYFVKWNIPTQNLM